MGSQASVNTNDKEQQLKKASKMSLIRSLLPIVGLVVIFLLFNFLTDFRMMGNMSLVLSQVYVTMISAMGVFFIMTMGGLDFSQGSILGISSIVVCMLSKYSIPLAIIGGIAAGAAIGAINGYFYVNRKIKSFIVTICTMFLFRGFIKYLTTNAPVAGSAKLINYDSTALKVACTVVILAIGFVAFRFTKFGTYLKAIGAGEKAAMFSGIRTDRMKFLIYVLAGAITGFAAFINVIKVGSVTSSGKPVRDTDPDRTGTWWNANFRWCKGSFREYYCRIITLHRIKQWINYDGILYTDDAAHSGYCIPDLRCSICRS